VVLLCPAKDLWAHKNLALVVQNNVHTQALHLLSSRAMPAELIVATAVNNKETLTLPALLPEKAKKLFLLLKSISLFPFFPFPITWLTLRRGRFRHINAHITISLIHKQLV